MKISKSFVPYLNVTAHLDSVPDQGMLSQKGANYFPYVIFMDQDGEVLTELRPTSEAAVTLAHDIAGVTVELNARLEKDENDRSANLGMKVLKAISARRPPSLDEFDRLLRSPDLDPRVKKVAERGRNKVAVGEVISILRRAQRAARRGDAKEVNSKRDADIYALFKKGIRVSPEENWNLAFAFYGSVVGGAVEAGDLATARQKLGDVKASYAAGLDYYEGVAAKNPKFRKRIERIKANLGRLMDEVKKKLQSAAPDKP